MGRKKPSDSRFNNGITTSRTQLWPLQLAGLGAGMLPIFTAKMERGFDSIGWSGTLMHDRSKGCIHPPPFGNQCTMLRANAISTCLLLMGCSALTCPDPHE